MLPIRRCVHTRTLQVIQCRQWGIRSLSGEALEKTKYFDHHIEHGGKMVPFAGYELPVQYKGTGVLKEHLHTRAEDCASVFDVGHMGQIKWHGKDSVTFLEKMVCGDIGSLKPSEGKLSLIMNEAGGIMDDCVISNAGEYIYMVVNGACKYKDMDHFNHYLQGSGLDVSMEYMHDQQLLALQGPGAARVLSELSPDLNVIAMNFMTTTVATVGGVSDCRVTRCGYTGEDGFELSVDAENAHALMDALQKQNNVQLAGLGARDSLRLEAGLCLYGNDIDEKTNPIEAGLTWTIGGPKSRRRVEQGFLGAEKFLEPSGKLVKQPRKRVGISGMKVPARRDTPVYDVSGENQIGVITSGGFGPTYDGAIAMGYVQTDFAKEGTEIMLSVRGKMVSAVVTSMPFVPCHYYRAP